MKASTAAELVGFGCGVAAATVAFGALGGLISAAIFLLFIGYAVEDQVAGVSIHRGLAPLARRRALWAVRRANRRSRRRKAREGRSFISLNVRQG